MTKYIGDDWVFDISIKDSSGNPIDITANSYKFFLVESVEDQEAKIEADFTITDGPGGLATATIPRSETATLCEGRKPFCIQQTVAGLVSVIDQNKIDVLQAARTK